MPFLQPKQSILYIYSEKLIALSEEKARTQVTYDLDLKISRGLPAGQLVHKGRSEVHDGGIVRILDVLQGFSQTGLVIEEER